MRFRSKRIGRVCVARERIVPARQGAVSPGAVSAEMSRYGLRYPISHRVCEGVSSGLRLGVSVERDSGRPCFPRFAMYPCAVPKADDTFRISARMISVTCFITNRFALVCRPEGRRHFSYFSAYDFGYLLHNESFRTRVPSRRPTTLFVFQRV